MIGTRDIDSSYQFRAHPVSPIFNSAFAHSQSFFPTRPADSGHAHTSHQESRNDPLDSACSPLIVLAVARVALVLSPPKRVWRCQLYGPVIAEDEFLSRAFRQS